MMFLATTSFNNFKISNSPDFSAEVPRPRDPLRGAGRDGVVGAGPAERRPGRHQALRGLRRQLHQQVLGPRQEEERTVRNKTGK